MNSTEYLVPAIPEWTANFKTLSRRSGELVVAIGCLVLVGWMLDIEALKSVVPGLAGMKSMSALLFVLSGASLWLYARQKSKLLTQACAFLVLLVSMLTIGEYLLNTDLGIDQIFVRDDTPGALHPGRMSPSTAFSFFLISAALLFGDRQTSFRDAPALGAFVIAVLALIGYLYGASSLYQIGAYSSMALHTALSFALLSLGILFARPERGLMRIVLADTAGGDFLRRLIPTAFFLPAILGWFWLTGQRLGLYDPALGLAFMAISLIISLGILLWLNARQLTELDIRRRQIDSDLLASEHRFHTTLDRMMEGCQIIGYDWRYLYLNDTAIKHSRATRESLLGRTMMECYPGLEHTALFTTLQRCIKERTPAQMVHEFLYPDGSRGWFDLSIQPAPDGIFILSSDISRRRQAEQALLEREMKLAKLLDILPVGISILDAERQIMFTNPALQSILEVSERELQEGKYANRRYLRANGTPMPREELASTRALDEKREIDDLETGVVREDGSTVWTSVSAVPVNFSDWKLVLVTVDITSRKQAEQEIIKLNAELEKKVARRTAELAAANEQLRQLAILDELTGLYNRRGFLLLAEEQILLAKRTGQNLIVFYGDMDGLKQINDQGGHAAGDQALVTAAQALNGTFRASDIKARLSGDEFIVLAIECGEPNASALLDRLDVQLAQHNLSMSVGVTMFDTGDEISLADLISRADEAMYEVKSGKRGRQRP